MLRGQRRLEARRGGFETPAQQPGRRSGALKQLVATGCFWPGPGIGDRRLSTRPPRTAGFRRDDRNREDRQPTLSGPSGGLIGCNRADIRGARRSSPGRPARSFKAAGPSARFWPGADRSQAPSHVSRLTPRPRTRLLQTDWPPLGPTSSCRRHVPH